MSVLQASEAVGITKKFDSFDSLRSGVTDCETVKDEDIDKEEMKAMMTREKKHHKKKLSVSFHQSVKVVLIPTRLDYKLHKLQDNLWWNQMDYKNFHCSTIKEIQAVMGRESIDCRAASALLYTGHISCKHENEFENENDSEDEDLKEIFDDVERRPRSGTEETISALSSPSMSPVNYPEYA
jgi:hypothetical protein